MQKIRTRDGGEKKSSRVSTSLKRHSHRPAFCDSELRFRISFACKGLPKQTLIEIFRDFGNIQTAAFSALLRGHRKKFNSTLRGYISFNQFDALNISRNLSRRCWERSNLNVAVRRAHQAAISGFSSSTSKNRTILTRKFMGRQQVNFKLVIPTVSKRDYRMILHAPMM